MSTNLVSLTDGMVFSYLFKAGGAEAIESYVKSSNVGITDVVLGEILKSPTGEGLVVQVLVRNDSINYYNTQAFKDVASGAIKAADAGEVSIAEVYNNTATVRNSNFSIVSDDTGNTWKKLAYHNQKYKELSISFKICSLITPLHLNNMQKSEII